MRIRMLETRHGCEDGFRVRRFEKGKEYEVADTLAKSFLAAGFAVPVRRRTTAKPKPAPPVTRPRVRKTAAKPKVVHKKPKLVLIVNHGEG